MTLPITIAIDDANPKPGWQILGTPVEKWLRQLNDQFGAKFTLFVPSNYHGEYPLSEHKEWVKELLSIPWIELATHGHYHATSDKNRFGECEFFELNNIDQCSMRIGMIDREWLECDMSIYNMGWKSPGWLCSQPSMEVVQSIAQWTSLHYEHNHNLQWNCPTFFGHDGIQSTDIRLHNVSEKHPLGMVMFTSHVAGDWNDNVWNEKNFEQLKLSLKYLTGNYSCDFKIFNELI